MADMRAMLTGRSARLVALSVFFLALLVVIGVRVLTATPVGRSFVESRIEALNVRGQTVAIDNLRGDLLGRFAIGRLEVSDEDGVWLTADNAAVRWSPLALVSGRVSIDTLSVASVDVARRPVLAPSRAGERGGAFGIKTYRLGGASLPSIRLGEGVAGPQAAYAATASVLIEGRAGQLAVEIVPKNAGGDVLDVDLAWGGNEPLSGHADIRGRPGGLIATLISAPQGEPVSVVIDAVRRNGDWSMLARGQIGEREALVIEGQRSDETIIVRGDADLSLTGRTREIAARLGGLAVFDVTIEPGREATGVEIDLTAPNLLLRASGSVQTGDALAVNGLSARLDLRDAAGVTGLEGLALAPVDIVGDLERTGTGYAFDGRLESARVALDERELRDVVLRGAAGQRDGDLDLDVTLEAARLVGVTDVPGELAQGPLKLTTKGRVGLDETRYYAERFSLSTTGGRINGAGVLSGDEAMNLAGRLRVRPEADLPGTGELKWTLKGDPGGALTGSVSGDIVPVIEAGELASMLGESVSVSGDLSRSETGALAARNLTVGAAAGTLEGRADYQGERLSASGTAALVEGGFGPVSWSPVDARFEAAGPLDALRVQMNAQAASVTLAGQHLSDVTAAADLGLGDGVSGRVTASGAVLSEPFSLAVSATPTETGWAFSDIDAQWADLALAGSAGLGGGVEELAADTALSGALPGGGTVDGTLSFDAGRLDARIGLGEIDAGLLFLQRTDLLVTGTWPNLRLDGLLDGTLTLADVTSELRLAPDIAADFGARTIDAVFSGQIGDAAFRTEAPLAIGFGETLTANGTVTGFGGAAALDASLADGSGLVRLDLSAVDLSQIGPLVGRASLRGELGGGLVLQGRPDVITGTATATIEGLARGAPGAPQAGLTLNGDLSEGWLRATLKAADPLDGLDLTGEIALPVTTSFEALQVRPDPARETTASLTGGGSIAALWAVVAPSDLRLEGDVDLDLSASGTWPDLRPSGPVSVRSGLIEDGVTGLLLEGLEMDASVDPMAVNVQRLAASGGRGGRVTGAGTYAYDGAGQVTLRLDALDAFERRDVRAAVSGDLALRRSDGQSDLVGKLNVIEARINLSQLPRGGYTVLDVTFEDDPPPPREEDTRRGVRLDIGLVADRRIFIEGAGVDTEWALDARIAGSPADPDLRGQATLVRGEADLIGRRFRFEEGVVRFDGAPDESELSLRASRDFGGVTTIVTVTGDVMEPDIALSSDPALPESEVLSRALFGQSPAQLSPLQAAELAGAAATLAGGDTFDLTGPLQAATGLDRLDIGFTATGGAVVSTGKYVAEDVYLQVETGATGAPGVSVEWTPLDNLAVNADIDPELGPRLEINWKRDFDRFGPGDGDDDAPEDVSGVAEPDR